MKNSLYPILSSEYELAYKITYLWYFIQLKMLKAHIQSHFSPGWPGWYTVESILVKHHPYLLEKIREGKVVKKRGLKLFKITFMEILKIKLANLEAKFQYN